MDEAEAVDDGLLGLSALFRSRVTTDDLGCGMKDPVCGEADLELLAEVLGAASPETPVGLRTILR